MADAATRNEKNRTPSFASIQLGRFALSKSLARTHPSPNLSLKFDAESIIQATHALLSGTCILGCIRASTSRKRSDAHTNFMPFLPMP